MKTVGISTMEKFDNRQLNSVGSSRIRMRWLLPYWEEAEEFVIGKKYDVHIYQKVYWKPMMEQFKGIQILDLCDPDWLENKPVFEYVDLADAVVTSTEALADYIRRIRPNALVRCIPDRVYLPETIPLKSDYSERLQNLVWFGYAQNAHYIENTFDELIKRGLDLVCVSDQPIDPPISFRNKLKIHNIPFNYGSANKEMIKYDAVLMPDPLGDERAKFKSNNKTLQAWALKMPVVKVPEDLDRLASRQVRIDETNKLRKEIEEKWDVRFSVDEYRNLIDEIRQKKNA